MAEGPNDWEWQVGLATHEWNAAADPVLTGWPWRYCGLLRCSLCSLSSSDCSGEPGPPRDLINGIGIAHLVAIARHFPTRGQPFSAKPAGQPRSERPARKVF